MTFVNKTPHPIVLRGKKGEETTFPPVAPPARIAITQEVVGELDGFPVRKTVYGQIENLPEPTSDTIYIVSLVVLQATGRQDVVAPDSAGPTAIRSNGQVVAVTGFVTVEPKKNLARIRAMVEQLGLDIQSETWAYGQSFKEIVEALS